MTTLPPPHRPVRRNGALSLGLAVLIALAVTPWLLHVGFIRPPSPLTRDLPGASRAASQVFDARVQARFPPGASEAQLIAELSRQGFHEGQAEREMVRRQASLICNIAARVSWRADHAGRILRARGAYREEGCL